LHISSQSSSASLCCPSSGEREAARERHTERQRDTERQRQRQRETDRGERQREETESFELSKKILRSASLCAHSAKVEGFES